MQSDAFKLWQDLELESKLPVDGSIRTWLVRVGVGWILLKEVKTKDGELIWYVDHSCQIGIEKMLAIPGVSPGRLSTPRHPLENHPI